MEGRVVGPFIRGGAPGGPSRRARRVVLLAAIVALTAVMAALRQHGGPAAAAAGPIALALFPLCYLFIRLETPARPRGGLPAAF